MDLSWRQALGWCTGGAGETGTSVEAPVRTAEWLAEHRAPQTPAVLVALHVAGAIVALIELWWASTAGSAVLWAPLVIVSVVCGTRLTTITFIALAMATGFLADRADAASGGVMAVDALVRFTGLVGVAVLTSWSVLATVELARRSRTDVGTGLLNRAGFLAAAERERERAVRNGTSLSIVYFDLDGLKDANDHHGHAYGDAAISRFAHHLDRSRRIVDVAGRLGGDEFVLLLPATGSIGVQQVLRRLYRAIERDAACLPASAGAVTWANPPAVRSMLRQADTLMYRSKGQGGRSWAMLDLTGSPNAASRRGAPGDTSAGATSPGVDSVHPRA